MSTPAPERLEAILWTLKQNVKCSIKDLELATGYSESSCYHSIKLLLHRGKVEIGGYIENPFGGSKKILYRLSTGAPVIRSVKPNASGARVVWKPRKARRTGGGGVAGRITIGRGALWGAGLV